MTKQEVATIAQKKEQLMKGTFTGNMRRVQNIELIPHPTNSNLMNKAVMTHYNAEYDNGAFCYEMAVAFDKPQVIGTGYRRGIRD